MQIIARFAKNDCVKKRVIGDSPQLHIFVCMQHFSALPAFKMAEGSGGKKEPAQGDFFSCPEKNFFRP